MSEFMFEDEQHNLYGKWSSYFYFEIALNNLYNNETIILTENL